MGIAGTAWGIMVVSKVCPACGGLGKNMKVGFPVSKPCSRCMGAGMINVGEKLYRKPRRKKHK